jgi:exonuclease III
MDDRNFDVALLQETKTPTQNKLVHNTHFYFFGNEQERRAGVGIALSHKGQQAYKLAGTPPPTTSFCRRAGRIIALPLKYQTAHENPITYFVISAHLPHSGSEYPDEEYENCLSQLQHIINKRPEGSIPIIGCDANAMIGKSQKNPMNQEPDDAIINNLLGNFGKKQTNNRGKLFRNFMLQDNLCHTSSFFRKKSHYTHITNKNTARQIDFILLQKKDLKQCIDCEISKTTGTHSDHNAIVIKLRLATHLRTNKSTISSSKKTQI